DLCTLPVDFVRPQQLDRAGGRLSFRLPGGTVNGLHQLARASGASLFMVLLAAFAVVLSRFRGEDEVVIGSPVAGRTLPELESLMGCFVNTLVLRIVVDDTVKFRALVEQVKATVLGAHAHQDLPFERLVEALKPTRSLAYSPLFQILIV